MPSSTNFTGRMTRPAEDIGNPVIGVKFTVAVEDYDFGEKKRVTEFYDCVVFGQRADVVRNYGETGKHVWINNAKRKTRKYTASKGIHAGHEATQINYVVNEFELLPDGKGAGKAEPEEDESGNAW